MQRINCVYTTSHFALTILLRRNGKNPPIVLKEFIDSIKDIDNDKSP